MKVVQLRGTNGAGKTETVRQFMKHGSFQVINLPYHKKEIACHYDPQKRILILGRYDEAKTGGIDGKITNRNMLINVIMHIGKTMKPDVIIFEGIVYGVTYQFCVDVVKACKAIGYEYVGVCLLPPLDVAIQRVSERNGGKPIDVLSVQNKWFTTSRAHARLLKNGVNVRMVDTSKYRKEELGKILEEAIL